MSEALQTNRLGEDAAAFVRAGTPTPVVVREIVPPAAMPAAEPAKEIAATDSARTEPPRPAKKPQREKQPDFAPSAGLVSMTFRLPSEILAGLIRASADRKVRRSRPWSQQEMVAEAITEWLKERGYFGEGT